MEAGILVFERAKFHKTQNNFYSHQEYNKEEFTNVESIKEKIAKGEDLFGRNIKYKKVNVDDSFPSYVYNNKEKFKEWIL